MTPAGTLTRSRLQPRRDWRIPRVSRPRSWRFARRRPAVPPRGALSLRTGPSAVTTASNRGRDMKESGEHLFRTKRDDVRLLVIGIHIAGATPDAGLRETRTPASPTPRCRPDLFIVNDQAEPCLPSSLRGDTTPENEIAARLIAARADVASAPSLFGAGELAPASARGSPAAAPLPVARASLRRPRRGDRRSARPSSPRLWSNPCASPVVATHCAALSNREGIRSYSYSRHDLPPLAVQTL